MTHVKCRACGKTYNGKTGKDNTTNIVIYFAVIALVCIGVPVAVAAVSVLTMFLTR